MTGTGPKWALHLGLYVSDECIARLEAHRAGVLLESLRYPIDRYNLQLTELPGGQLRAGQRLYCGTPLPDGSWCDLEPLHTDYRCSQEDPGVVYVADAASLAALARQGQQT